MAVEDNIRQAQGLATETQARADDVRSKATTKGKIFVAEQIISALPAPVNVAAMALGAGLHAAFKVRPDAVSQPAAPDVDPTKLMAYTMAFAILKAMWCFIKSVLNPMPIIGMFFPLCSDDAQLAAGNDPATVRARTAASNPENSALLAAVDRFNREAGSGTIAAGDLGAIQTAYSEAQRAAAALQNISVREMDSGPVGITFDQFVASHASTPANPETDGGDVNAALRSRTSQGGPTSANISAQPVVEPEWQPTDQVKVQPTSYEEYRKLFGL